MTRDFGAHFNHLSGVYDSYAALASNDGVARYLVAEVSNYVKGPVLDIGVGTGNFSTLFNLGNVNIWGIDLSREMLKVAASKGIIPVCGNSVNLPFACDSFHTVMARQFLQYLEDDDLIMTMKEAKRVLAPGGFLILNHVTSPTDESIDKLRGFMSVNGAVTNFFTLAELTSIVASHGFEVLISKIHSTKVKERIEDFCGVRNITHKEMNDRLQFISGFADFELEFGSSVSYNRHYSLVVATKPAN